MCFVLQMNVINFCFSWYILLVSYFIVCLYLFCFLQSVLFFGMRSALFCVWILSKACFYKMFSDVNECEPNPCGENAVCKDTVGSYVCACKEDYTGDPFKGCTDIDECATLEKPCGTHAICENAVPGYNCICPQGYQAKPKPEVACEQVSKFFKYQLKLFMHFCDNIYINCK